ncbi:hypothetical protein SDC9_181873 [bioreactor metagenome]|uniref:Uncharacterized protein n=1 Tax=bioreactor metagenome TaxID=1076179 RepID=A0A645H6P1_9ZZZZ
MKIIAGFEVEVYFIFGIISRSATVAIRRHNMDIKITLRLGRAALSRQAHKEIALTEDAVAVPIQVMLIDFKSGNILLFIPFKAAVDHLIEEAVEFTIGQQRCLLLYLFVVIHDFVNVNVILPVALIKDNELPGHSLHNFA